MPTRPSAAAKVDLDAVRANVAELRETVGSSQVMAVVKADGYGHGAVRVARAALRGGAEWLGTATIEEALALREAGIRAPVLCWLNAPGARWTEAVAAGIDLSAGDLWTVRDVAAAAADTGVPARVHLKVDTGLCRGGAPPEQWPRLVDAALKAQADGHLEVVGLWSHLGSSDDPTDLRTERQIDDFHEAVRHARQAGARPEVCHLASSVAALTVPKARFDLVRPGIAVYGLWPGEALHPTPLRPAMTLTARLAQVKEVPAGQGVSYGHAYRTTGPARIGLVPLGYADGVPRHAGNTVAVLAAGSRRPIAGRVCMDQFMLDLGTAQAAAGDEVVLFGPGDDGEPTARDWALALGTITNELVCRIGERVTRVYSGGTE